MSLYVVLLSVLSLMIVLINSRCLFVILTSKILLKYPPTLLITNLIAMHLAQGIFVVPLYALFQVFNEEKWICNGYRFTYMLTFYGSCINVLLLSIDRLLAVKLLTSYHIIVTRKRVIKVIILCWAYVFGLCLIPFLNMEKAKSVLFTQQCKYNQPRVWSIVMIVLNTLLPYIAIVSIYAVVYRKIRKRHEFLQSTGKQGNGKKADKTSRHNQRRKTTVLVLTLVLCYAITWAPSIFYLLIQHLVPSTFNKSYYNSKVERALSFVIKFVNFFDAVAAPIIYCFNHDVLRSKLNKNKHSRERTQQN